MEAIMERSIQDRDAMGYFPGMYRLVTLTVQEAAEEGKFEDNERMDRLVIQFANRYLEAYEIYQAGGNPTLSWQYAFDAAKNKRLTVLQHLMLGMNAHINLDLGLSAASVCPGETIEGLENDFLQINLILSNLVDEVQDRVGKVAPVMRLVDRLGRRWDEKLAGVSMARFRDIAWSVATHAAALEGNELEVFVRLTDKRTSRLGNAIIAPSKLVTRLFWLASWLEDPRKARIVEALWQK